MERSPTSGPDELLLDEPSARRLLLAQALEEGDPDGRLVGRVERDQVDREALAVAGDPARGERLDERRYLLERSDRLVKLLGDRQPRLAALAERPPWLAWAAWGLPLAALAIGALIDRIDNPRQVNLLSPPLLAFLLWNLAVYVLLAAAALSRLRPRRAAGPAVPAAARWWSTLTPRRAVGVRGDVAVRFQRAWWNVARAMEGQRWRRILHASAAAWAVGVALSIVAGGLVREYRVGWESTLLDLPQVHAFLRALFAPVVALLPLEPFTQAELARLHFGSGADVGRVEARRWVALYVALLGVLVVLPRAVLALFAALRERAMAARVRVDLSAPYFMELLGRVRPARVVLGLVMEGDQPHPLATPLRQMADAPPPAAPGEPWVVLRTARGDSLQVVRWQPSPSTAIEPASGWWERLRMLPASQRRPAVVIDLVVLGGSDPSAWQPMLAPLGEAGKPVLLVATGGSEAAHAAALRALPVRSDVLPAASLPTWREDERLLACVQRLLPAYLAPAMERLAGRWREQAQQRLEASMRLLADELVQAARDSQEQHAQPIGVRQLVVRGEREAAHEGRRLAHAGLLARARERQAATDARLLSLHGLDGLAPATLLEHAVPERFRVAQSVHEPQAGLAGAASGAAMGAAVDLMTGGLTLGAASALGALVGGGAALAAAAWKNRNTAPGVSVVAFGEEMLDALSKAALLRYLAVAHERRATALPSLDTWTAAVEAALDKQSGALRAVWTRAREEGNAVEASAALAALLAAATNEVLESLHGPVR